MSTHDVLDEKKIDIVERLAKHHEHIKKYWFHDSVFKSSYYDASSIVVPRGERFVIHSVERLLAKAKDKKLIEEMHHLIHEETAHTRVHDAYNAMLKREGYNIYLSHKVEDWFFGLFEKYFPPLTNLGISMCIEFFTLIFAKHTFEKKVLEDDGIDKRLKRVWIWHHLEEIDHKSACYDLFKYLGGGYFRRVFCMMVTCMIFFPTVHLTHILLLKQNGGLYKPRHIARGVWFLFGPNGMYINSMKEWYKFFKPSFSPNQIVITHDVEVRGRHHPILKEFVK